MASKMISPNEMLQAAKDVELGGREPVDKRDWVMILMFMAANIAKGLEESACLLLRTIYEMPIEDEMVRKIAKYEMERKTS